MTVVHFSTTGANSESRQWCYSFKTVYWPSVDAKITVRLPFQNQTPSVCLYSLPLDANKLLRGKRLVACEALVYCPCVALVDV